MAYTYPSELGLTYCGTFDEDWYINDLLKTYQTTLGRIGILLIVITKIGRSKISGMSEIELKHYWDANVRGNYDLFDIHPGIIVGLGSPTANFDRARPEAPTILRGTGSEDITEAGAELMLSLAKNFCELSNPV